MAVEISQLRPAPEPDIETLPRTLDEAITIIRKLKAQVITLLQEKAKLTQEKNRLWQEKNRDKALKAIKSEHLQPIDKDITGYLLGKWEAQNTKRDASGRLCINKKWMAKDLGTSESTIDRRLERLERVGFVSDVVSHEEPESDQDRVFVVVQKANIEEVLRDPEQAAWPDDMPKQGGNQYQCRKCGTTNVAIKNVKWLICLDPTCPDYGKKHIIEPGEWRPQHVQNGHNKQKAQKQLAFLDKSAETAESAEPESNLRNDTPITPPLPQVAQDDSPSLDPHLASVLIPWLEKRRGDDRIIYATGNVDDTNNKYRYKEEGYIPDLAAYLAGDIGHIYGSRPGRADGTTWLLGYDFDDKQPEHDRNHVTYMTLLAAAGIASFYFSRRLGRGHLEIHFTRPVDALAAHQWIILPNPL